MKYIKVLATDSTNSELKKRFRKNRSMPNTCLSTNRQILGRGQRNESWQTEDHKNLTFSLLLNNLSLNPQEYFKLNALVSLGLVEFLNEKIQTTRFFVKWPNDILAGRQKICGILIENILHGKTIDHSVIGIGLNVNQTDFIDLPRAGSLKKITDQDFELDNLLKELVEKLEEQIYSGLSKSLAQILSVYEKHLFRKDEVSNFEFPDAPPQKGIIRGVSLQGKLLVEIQDSIHEFALKELKLIY